MTVQTIIDFLQAMAPDYMKYDWDNIGLLCGRRDQMVETVLVALDPFEHVCQEASAVGADLLLTHHPLIFRPTASVTEDNPVGRSILQLAASGISAVNAHTNLDCAPGGINDVLADRLGLTECFVLNPRGMDSEKRPYGLLRVGIRKEEPLSAFLAYVKGNLGTPVLRYADGGKMVHRVAVGGGACGDGLEEALRAGCDTFVTADVKYNQFWDARQQGLNLIDAGHFYTENPITDVLAQRLRCAFPNLKVLVSNTHKDCMKFF